MSLPELGRLRQTRHFKVRCGGYMHRPYCEHKYNGGGHELYSIAHDHREWFGDWCYILSNAYADDCRKLHGKHRWYWLHGPGIYWHY
jgi:hypothetical protein